MRHVSRAHRVNLDPLFVRFKKGFARVYLGLSL